MERFLLLEKSSPRIVLNSPGDRRKSPSPGLSHFWLYPHLLTNDHTNSDPPSIDGNYKYMGFEMMIYDVSSRYSLLAT